MRGDVRRKAAAQLALLDAMIFFAIAMMISGSLAVLGENARSNDRLHFARPSNPAADMLEALLQASIGLSMQIGTDGRFEVASAQSVAECLRDELYSLAIGLDRETFSQLNDAIADIIDGLAGPAMNAYLIAVSPDGSSVKPFLAIPEERTACTFAIASHVDMPVKDSGLFSVILVLEPTAFPELE